MILRCFVFICVAVATAERGGGEETPKAKHIFDGAATVALARNEARPLSASMQQAPEQQQPLRSQLPGGTQEERKKPEAETRKERKLNDGYVMSGNAELQTAVGAWCSDEASAEATYGDISTWVTSQVTDMSNLFSSHCSTVYTFNANVSRWNIENVVSLRETFKNARAFNLPLNDWNTRNVIDLEGTFEYAFAFNQPLHKWNTSAVTTMDYLFRRALVFDQEINVSRALLHPSSLGSY
jgi:surface protein